MRREILILLRTVFHVLTAAIQDDPANKNFMDEVLPVLVYFYFYFFSLLVMLSPSGNTCNSTQFTKHCHL